MINNNQMIRAIGIDVHKDSYSISAFNPQTTNFSAETTVAADSKSVITYLKRLKKEIAAPVTIEIGYEAGPTGFGLKRDLEKAGYTCHVMAPTSIYRPAAGVKVKTDAKDARTLAKAVYWGSYSEVVPLSEEDESYRDYIRMRDDRKEALKKAKQNLLSFLLRKDRKYSGSPWTQKHLSWLKKQEFESPIDKLTIQEYLNEVTRLNDAIVLLDAKIEEFSREDRYKDKVDKLRCFAGIDTHVAMVMITEIGDYNRFTSAEAFSSYIGLCPGEHSSGKSTQKGGITKAGNSHCRKLLCESANSIARTNPYKKSKRLLERQKGISPDIISYADRGSTRIKSKYFNLLEYGKNANVAKAACARELSCFIWGMMTGHMESRGEIRETEQQVI